MPYILRDGTGKVARVSVHNFGGAEGLPHSHPEIVGFLRTHGQDPGSVEEALKELQRTDAEMVRAVEDLITALLKKNILKMTDLPKPVQERITSRVKLRMLIEDAYHRASNVKSP